jgi:hypothetical protein
LRPVKHDLPAYWASYLINGDASGLEPEEKKACDDYLTKRELPGPVDCKPAGFGRFDGLGCELETYTFLLPKY